ncbi:hypothetical protein BJV77DRAFT_286295 [Russula vinacea]|nr:hypothetical protein BJV77DRAFT_286295 [Russula vinacea]
MCLSFLRQCAEYGDRVSAVCLRSMASPTSSPICAGAPYELRERTMRLQSEMIGVSTENAAGIQGSRKFKAAYKKALSLEKKKTSELNALVEKLSSWVMITHSHGLRDDALSDIITLEQVRELWVKSRDSIRTTLAALKNESATQLFYRSAPPVATRRLSVMKRWLINLV